MNFAHDRNACTLVQFDKVDLIVSMICVARVFHQHDKMQSKSLKRIQPNIHLQHSKHYANYRSTLKLLFDEFIHNSHNLLNIINNNNKKCALNSKVMRFDWLLK